jgi:thiol-disulfide isomerase/thioredoxin
MISFRAFMFVAAGISLFHSGFVAPAQSSRAGTTQSAAITAVHEIDTEGLKGLLKRDTAVRPLLVNFWATWCDPCRDEFPDLVEIDEDYRGKKFDFIAVSLDDMKDLTTEVPKFLHLMKASMPVYLLNANDPEPAIKYVDPQWDGAMPATFLFNSEGKLVYKHFGRINAAELRTEIDKVLQSKVG